jgi:hypothetical protein
MPERDTKTRHVPKKSMPVLRTLFEEMTPSAPTIDDPVRLLCSLSVSLCHVSFLMSGDS